MYVQGFLLAVPGDKKDAYRDMAEKAAAKFAEYGITELVENWEEDVADGKVTDFRRATKAKEGEKIVFSWVIWPDKATADEAHQKMSEDPFWTEDVMAEMPFDGMRMMWGGFTPLVTLGRDG